MEAIGVNKPVTNQLLTWRAFPMSVFEGQCHLNGFAFSPKIRSVDSALLYVAFVLFCGIIQEVRLHRCIC